MYCEKCGSPNTEGASFCSECGARLGEPSEKEAAFAAAKAKGAQENNDTESSSAWGGYAGGLSPEEEQLIGEKLEYYAPRFVQMRAMGSKISWNWCGMFIFPYWAIYRKMYKECVIYIVAINLLSWATGGIFFSLPIYIGAGMFANWLYFRSVSAHAVNVVSMPQVQKEAYIKKFGGVSSTNVKILMAIVILWSIVTAIIGL